MKNQDTIRAWKDPEDDARAAVAAHPSGDADLNLLVGGLAAVIGSEKLGSTGCCPSWSDHTC